MKWKVLVSAPYMQPVPDKYLNLFAGNDIEIVVVPVEERLSEEELLGIIGDYDGVICGDDRFTAKVLKAATKLKVIAKWGTGIDSIDREEARARGIAVRNTPNAFTEPVADTVMGYLLCFARQLPWMNQHMQQGKWEKIPGRALSECTLGIIGVGNIGRAVIKRAIAFGMRVVGTDIIDIPQDFLDATGLVMVSKDELLQQADFVTLNCDLNPTSFHIMGSREFELMRSTACLINTARGPLVDEAALIAALREQKIAGAALDVFEVEPLPVESPLRTFENVMLAPHNSNSSPTAWERVHENTVKCLFEGLRA